MNWIIIIVMLLATTAMADDTIAIKICVPVQWEVSTGNVVGYELAMDGIVIGTVLDPPAELCAPDMYVPHSFTVTGVDEDGNLGPTSEPLEIEWEWDTDINRTNVTDFGDYGKMMGRVRDNFGVCNNGYIKVPCES